MRYFPLFSIALVMLLLVLPAKGQDVSNNKEINDMFRNGVRLEVNGKYPEAIIIYRQLLNLEPNNDLVKYQLATLLFRSSDYPGAIVWLKPLAAKGIAKEEVYQLLATSYQKNKEAKKALKALNNGLEVFPHSGVLYHQRGQLLEEAGDSTAAFLAYADGIQKSPNYPANYREAISIARQCNRQLWSLLYSETYLLVKKDTIGDALLKRVIVDGWRTYYNNLANTRLRSGLTPFEGQVWNGMLRTTPIVSAGFSVASVADARAQFLKSWPPHGYARDTFYLFHYQQQLTNAGILPLYIKWLFSSDCSQNEVAQWNAYKLEHPIQVTHHNYYLNN